MRRPRHFPGKRARAREVQLRASGGSANPRVLLAEDESARGTAFRHPNARAREGGNGLQCEPKGPACAP